MSPIFYINLCPLRQISHQHLDNTNHYKTEKNTAIIEDGNLHVHINASVLIGAFIDWSHTVKQWRVTSKSSDCDGVGREEETVQIVASFHEKHGHSATYNVNSKWAIC